MRKDLVPDDDMPFDPISLLPIVCERCGVPQTEAENFSCVVNEWRFGSYSEPIEYPSHQFPDTRIPEMAVVS